MWATVGMVAAAMALIPPAPAAAAASGGASSAAALVDTRDGSLGAGFPQVGAGLPFGMISPGPDTAMPDGSQDPVDYVGYSYQDPDIRGFSLTHFDGAGIQIAGDLPFMPIAGRPQGPPLDDASPYDHATEVAQPGYYAVTLARYGIRTELTATTRAAMMRFTYPAGSQAGLLAEVTRGINGVHTGAVGISGDRTLTGWVKSDVGYKLYFAASFDHPFAQASPLAGGGEYLRFDTAASPTVTMRVAISYVDLAGAQDNLSRELPASRGFAETESAARAAWDRRLSDIVITGGSLPERETFYDNLYRSLLLPTVFDDADGRYLGFDGQLHTVTPGHHQYTNLSLWDTYRTQMPLLELVEPSVAHDVLASMIADADQNHGVIPRWVQANIDRGIMGGDSGSAALADGAAEGLLTRAESAHALDLLTAQATHLPPVWPREHLDDLVRYGYVPNDRDGIGASLTLEYGIDDYAVAELARALGAGTQLSDALTARASDWHNLVDPSTRFIRPRNSSGSWATPTAGRIYNPMFQDGYQEGTGWQYLWSVPQDPAGLATAIGGTATAVGRLDTFFTQALNSPLAPVVPRVQQYGSFFGVYYVGDQYTPANEPDLWAPWFYDFYGQPWKAQKVARAEMSAYDQTPEGMPGNDDAGEMSAWYVLAALGIYHATPGVDAWELSSPTFPQATLRLGPRVLRIQAPGATAATPYVQGLSLDGRPVVRTYLTSCQLGAGGTLRFTLGPLPDRAWGTGAAAAPPSATRPSPEVDACAAELAG
jgi:predicted alpha-1,2-mannosidase